MARSLKTTDLCDRPCVCGFYCAQHHTQVCVGGGSPRDIRKAEREQAQPPAIERLRDRLTEPDDPPGLREIAAAVVELADMLRARRPAP
jgi:hypothetical protein